MCLDFATRIVGFDGKRYCKKIASNVNFIAVEGQRLPFDFSNQIASIGGSNHETCIEYRPYAGKPAAWLLAGLLMVCLPTNGVAEDSEDTAGVLVPSNSAAKNFYGGASLGLGNNDYPDSNQDGSVSGISEDNRDTVYSFFAGYQLNENFAIEGGYTDFGESTFEGTSSGGPSWEAGQVSARQESDGWQLGVLGRWPITDRWYALGYVGWLWWESKETFVEPSATTTVSESGSDATFALGLEWDAGLKDRILYRFMGSHSQVGETGYDINTASGEIVYRFP